MLNQNQNTSTHTSIDTSASDLYGKPYDCIGKPALQHANTCGADRPRDVDALVRYAATDGAITGQDVQNMLSGRVLDSVREWSAENPLPCGHDRDMEIAERVARGRVLFQASKGEISAATMADFEQQAHEQGFDSEECGGERAMVRMLRAGILPADVCEAVETGRVFFCFELHSLSIDGHTQTL